MDYGDCHAARQYDLLQESAIGLLDLEKDRLRRSHETP